jgi:hypothetical protein
MGFAPVTCPPTPTLEQLFYPNARTIASAAFALVYDGQQDWIPDQRPDLEAVEFKGPF